MYQLLSSSSPDLSSCVHSGIILKWSILLACHAACDSPSEQSPSHAVMLAKTQVIFSVFHLPQLYVRGGSGDCKRGTNTSRTYTGSRTAAVDQHSADSCTQQEVCRQH